MKLMNWKFFLLTGIGCVIVFGVGVFAAYMLWKPMRTAEPVKVMASVASASDVQAAVTPSPTLAPKPLTTVSKSYVVGVQDGCVAVFIKQADSQPVLKQKTNIPANFLPPEEQERLRTGIPAEDDYRLSKILEAYGS